MFNEQSKNTNEAQDKSVNYKDKETNMKIGKWFKRNCELTDNDKIYYQMHQRNPKLGFEPLYSL